MTPKLAISLKSLRFRIAALFVGIFAFCLLVLSALAFGQFNTVHRNEFDRSLYNYAVDIAQGINVNVFGDLSLDVDAYVGKGKSFPFAIGRSFFQLVRMDGSIISKSKDLGKATLPISTATLKVVTATGVDFRTIDKNDLPTLIKSSGTLYRQLSLVVNKGPVPNFILQIAVPLALLLEERRNLFEMFSFAIPLALVVSLIGGIYLSGKALEPIQGIIAKAKSLNPAQLDERLPVPPVDDELRALSTTLNEMLERIQAMFKSQERFVADASHQLKTPLAVLRGEIDIALQRPRTPEETKTLMLSLSHELAHLSKTVNDLLLLARVDAGVAFLSTQPVRVDELALEAVSKLEKLAREREIAIKLDLVKPADENGDVKSEAAFVIEGDEDLLQSMLSEIIDNAIKFSNRGQTINIQVSDLGRECLIKVQDFGPGIPENLREKIFERFYRAGVRDVPGSGLGLSISKKIAQIHKGDLTYDAPAQGGSIFSILIKKV